METLYILKYTLQGFELTKHEILSDMERKLLPCEDGGHVYSGNENYITYYLDSGRTNVVRKTKLNKITMYGGFSFVAYFTDPKLFPRIKADMCDEIDVTIRKQELRLKQNKEMYKEFLFSKLGDKL